MAPTPPSAWLSGSSPSQTIAAQLLSVWVLVPSATQAHDVIDRITTVRREAFAEFDNSAELVVYRGSVGEQRASWQRCQGNDLDPVVFCFGAPASVWAISSRGSS